MNTDITVLKDYLPFLLPLIILQLILIIFAVSKVMRRKKFKILNRPTWILIIIFANLIGPIFYLVTEEYNG